MTDADKGAFAALITDALAYWRQDVSAFVLRVWWDGCRGFDLEQVGKALSAHAADAERGRFPPTLADIVRQLQGTQTDRSLLAWGKVLDAMQTVGAYASVAFDDPAIHAAVLDLGGWPTVCRSTVDDLPHLQRRFCAGHKAFAARPTQDVIGYLVGAQESENRGRGMPVRPPVLIGDPDRARALIAAGQASGPRTRITHEPTRAATVIAAPRKQEAIEA